MNTSLLAAIGVAVLVVCFFLLRKSSKKEVPPTPESVQEPLEETAAREKGETAEEPSLVDEEPEPTDVETLQKEKSVGKEPEEEQGQVDELAEPSMDEQVNDALAQERTFEEILLSDQEIRDADEESFADILEEDKSEADGSVEDILFLEDEDQLEAIPDEASDLILEEEPADEAAAEPEPDFVVEQELVEEEPAEDEAIVPTLTIEVYETRLRKREKEQQQALAEAINNGDDIKRDHLQIELVAITDRISLLQDSYNQELEWRQAALNAFDEMAAATDAALRDQLKESLLCGETEAAEEFFAGIVDKQGPDAPVAAFLSGQLAEARVDLYHALERYRKAVELDGDNCDYLRVAGVMARKLYRYRDARPVLEKLVELLEKEDKNSVDLALARRELGYTYALSGSLKQAGPLYKQAMKTIAGSLGPEHLEMGLSWSQIAELQEAKGQYEQAEPTYSKALAIMEQELGLEHPALDHVLEKLAGLDAEIEQDNKAAALYERLCAIREKSLGETHPKLAMALQNLAESYRLQGQYEPSEESYKKALAIMEENHGDNHPAVAAVLQELAKLCRRQKKNDEAERLQQRASEIFEQSIQDREENINEDDLNLQDK